MKILLKYYLLTTFLLITIFDLAITQTNLDKLGQSTMNFLLVSTSSRGSGVGEAMICIGSSTDAMFFNPAGMAVMSKQYEAQVSITQWIADIQYLSAAACVNLENWGVFGIHLIKVNYGTLYRTTIATQDQSYNYRDGYIDWGPMDNVGAYSLGLSYSRFLNNQFSMGGTVKLASQSLGESILENGTKKNDASKIAFDAGVRYVTGLKNFTFGMAIRNFASSIRREEMDERLPLTFTLGGSIDVLDIFELERNELNSVLLEVDFLHSNNYSERVNIGTDIFLSEMFNIRFGYQTNRDAASWSLGFGAHTELNDMQVEVNYTFSKMSILNNVNRLSLCFGF